jgi:hypothetical protein
MTWPPRLASAPHEILALRDDAPSVTHAAHPPRPGACAPGIQESFLPHTKRVTGRGSVC